MWIELLIFSFLLTLVFECGIISVSKFKELYQEYTTLQEKKAELEEVIKRGNK